MGFIQKLGEWFTRPLVDFPAYQCTECGRGLEEEHRECPECGGEVDEIEAGPPSLYYNQPY